jgi:hypothetical protein
MSDIPKARDVADPIYKIVLVGEAWGERTVLIDEEDWPRVSPYTWCVFRQEDGRFRVMRKDPKYGTVLLHRFILQLTKGDGTIVDHINENTLDNRKENLRLVSKRGNALNSYRSKSARIIERHGNRYRVRPFVNGVRINLGSYTSEEEALEVVRRYRNASSV